VANFSFVPNWSALVS